MTTPPSLRTAAELGRDLRAGELDAEELVDAARAAWAASEVGTEPVRAFLSTDWEATGKRAREIAGRLAGNDDPGPLAGLPVAVKDNLCTLDLPTTCGSRLLEGWRAPYEATVVRRLREAGAVVVGKTNLDEFGMGASTEHSAYGPTLNPVDRGRVPGGSSGGSAAAVAAGIVPFALGSDTGGSVRQPASFCGVVGIRPTWGAVSRYGLVAFASSLDQVGALGRTVGDAALLLRAVMGRDPRDATSSDHGVPDLGDALGRGVEGMTIGVPEECFGEGVDGRVRDACRAALRRLEAMGAEVREVSLPHLRFAVPAYAVLATAEASSNLARFDGARFGVRAPGAATLGEVYERTRALFGAEARRRIVLGTHVLSAGHQEDVHGRARAVRALVARDFRWAWASGVDALFTPTTPTPAFPLGSLTEPFGAFLSDVFTIPPSLAGLPATSLPVGEADGLPVGGQIVCDRWQEPKMVRIADALERALAAEAAS